MIYVVCRNSMIGNLDWIIKRINVQADVYKDNPCRLFYQYLLEIGTSPDDLISGPDILICYNRDEIIAVYTEFFFFIG